MKQDEQSFLGRGWSFPPVFSKTERGVQMSSEDQDIEESLYILLSTTPGERIMQPYYGCGLKSQVFEHLDDTVETTIRNLIQDAIFYFESRIEVEDIKLIKEKLSNGLLEIHIEYTIRATNSRRNMVYPFYLNEGSDIV